MSGDHVDHKEGRALLLAIGISIERGQLREWENHNRLKPVAVEDFVS